MEKVLGSFKVDNNATIKITYSGKRLFTTLVKNGIEYNYAVLNNNISIENLDIKRIQKDPENFCIEEIMKEYCMDAEDAQSYFVGVYAYSFGNVLG